MIRDVDLAPPEGIGQRRPGMRGAVLGGELDRDLLAGLDRQRRHAGGQGGTKGIVRQTAADGCLPGLGGRHVGGAVAWQLKHEEAARDEHPDQLGDIARAVARRHVLQHQRRVDEVERGIGKERQVGHGIQVIGASIGKLVVLTRDAQHGLRDVDAVALREVRGHGLRQPAGAAAEIQRAASHRRRRAGLLRSREDGVDLQFAATEKLRHVPSAAALVGVREHGPEGIATAQSSPMSLERAKPHELYERILSTRVDLFLYQLNISGLTVLTALIASFFHVLRRSIRRAEMRWWTYG